ncbi:ZIP family metal transporter [Tessaracoccus sp.]
MPEWLFAGLTGLGAGAALLLGSAIAWAFNIPTKVVAGIMAFGAGVLISALAFDLVDEAVTNGGLTATVAGFLTGALIYVALNILLARHGARHRKRSGDKQPDAKADSGGAIAIGALLDGIPESMVLGLGFLTGGGVSISMLAAVFISNVPEGLSSSAGWKKAGRSPLYVFSVWGGIAVISGVAALAGFLLLDGASPGTLAFVNALAAGAILAMISDTMIPEAFQEDSLYAGLLTTLGFLAALSLHHLG